MSIVFEEGQEIEIELPGGKFAGRILRAHDLDESEWIFKVDKKVATEAEVQQARKLLATIKKEEQNESSTN